MLSWRAMMQNIHAKKRRAYTTIGARAVCNKCIARSAVARQLLSGFCTHLESSQAAMSRATKMCLYIYIRLKSRGAANRARRPKNEHSPVKSSSRSAFAWTAREHAAFSGGRDR